MTLGYEAKTWNYPQQILPSIMTNSLIRPGVPKYAVSRLYINALITINNKDVPFKLLKHHLSLRGFF